MSSSPQRLGAQKRPGLQRPRPGSERRLEVVKTSREHQPAHRRRRRPGILPTAIVACGLLVAVAGHAIVAQDQVRLANVSAAITAAQLEHHQEVVSIATLESPSRVLRVAETTLHMSQPAAIAQLPHVPLGVPLPPPHVTSAAGPTQTVSVSSPTGTPAAP